MGAILDSKGLKQSVITGKHIGEQNGGNYLAAVKQYFGNNMLTCQ